MSEKRKKVGGTGKEAVFIVKPVAKGHGLDYLHITLIILAVILVALAFALSFSKPAQIIRCNNSTTNQSCGTISENSIHNASQVLSAAEHALVSYRNFNTSLSSLPYYSLVNQSSVSYVAAKKYWAVLIPYINPYNRSQVFNFSMLLYDSNLTVKNAFINSVMPVTSKAYSVLGLGSVAIDSATDCKTSKPIPVYLITDPYAPGAINALSSTLNASKKFNESINVSYFFVFSGYAISKYRGYGIQTTQKLGAYLSCASRQSGFNDFLSNLSLAYTGSPLSNLTLYDIAQGSSLNMNRFNACLANSSTSLNYQAQLASYYNLTSTPQLVVNCRYLTIPQTLGYAINYSLSKVS